MPTQWYELDKIDKFDEIEYSTEFTEEADDLMYKRFKMQQHKATNQKASATAIGASSEQDSTKKHARG